MYKTMYAQECILGRGGLEQFLKILALLYCSSNVYKRYGNYSICKRISEKLSTFLIQLIC